MGIISKFGATFRASKKNEVDRYNSKNDRGKNAYQKDENKDSRNRCEENNEENESIDDEDENVDNSNGINHDDVINHLENELNYIQKKKQMTIITDENILNKNKNKKNSKINNNDNKVNHIMKKKNTTFDGYGNISRNQNSFHDPLNYEAEQISRPASTTNNSEENFLGEHSPAGNSPEHSQDSYLGNYNINNDSNIDLLHSPPGDILNSIIRLGKISSSIKEPIRKFSPRESPEINIENRNKNNRNYRIDNENILLSNLNSSTNKYSTPHDFIKENNTNSEDYLYENSRNLEGPGSTSHYQSSFFHEKEIIDTRSVHSSANFNENIRKENVRKERSPVGWEHSPGEHFTSIELQHHLRTTNNNHTPNFNYHNYNNYNTSHPSYINDESNTNYSFHSNLTITPIPKMDVNYYDRCNVEVEVENSDLRGAVDKASEHASGLFAAAAKYGIYH